MGPKDKGGVDGVIIRPARQLSPIYISTRDDKPSLCTLPAIHFDILYIRNYVSMIARVCVCVCVDLCVRARVYVCVYMCARVGLCVV